jgi:uncharacterized protein (TIGR03437 family)
MRSSLIRSQSFGGIAFLLACSAWSGDAAAQISPRAKSAGATVAATPGVLLPASSTRVSAAPNPSEYGQSVLLTANVSPSTATGKVTFLDGTTTLGSSVLSGSAGPFNAIATFNATGLATGAHSLTAIYEGDAETSGSQSAATGLTVTKATTGTVLTSSSVNPSTFGQSVVLTASVSPSAATGTVTFKDGANTLATISLTNGAATFSTASLSVAAHSLTAVYGGDVNDAGSTSAAFVQTVNQAVSTISLSSSVNPSTFGQNVVLTATVSPSIVTGTVTFKDGANTLGSAVISGGSATLSTSALSVAAHSLTAVYGGDVNDAGSTSTAFAQTVNQAVSTISLSSSVNPSTFGQNVVLTATVSPSTATGTVTFKDGANTLATISLANGAAAFSTASLSVSAHSLTTTYSGDSGNAGSTSSTLVQVVSQTNTGTTLTSSPNPSTVGQSITLTASVTPAAATGTITFRDGEATLGTAGLSNGTAVFTVSTLAQGTHALAAAYSGDSSYLASVSQGSGPSLNFRSAAPGTLSDSGGQGTGFTTRLPGTGDSRPANDPLLTLNTKNGTLTMESTASDPNGQVNLANANFIGFPLSAAGVALNEDFSVSVTFRNVQYGQASDQLGVFVGTSGTNLFRGGVLFSDQANIFTAGTTGGADQNRKTDPALAPSAGDDVTLTLSRTLGVWTMTIQNLTTPARSGNLPLNQPAYLNGVTGLIAGVFANNSGNATVLTETLSSFGFTGGVQQVKLQTTSTSLTSSPNPSLPGQPVTLTATVPAPGATGTVTFLDGTTTLGTGTVSAGSATFQTTALAVGPHTINAVYSGDTAYAASTSPAAVHSVNQTITSTGLTAVPNSSSFGQTVTFTATVFPSGATGTVIFKDGTATLGSTTLSGGLATFSTAALAAGAHPITAAYGGDVTNAASVSSLLTQTVNPAVTTTGISSSPNPATVGQPLSLRATVTPANATGSVTFKDGAIALGTAALNSGSASVTVTGLTYGPHSLTAVYGGNQNYAPSNSAALNQSLVYPPLSITSSGLPAGLTGQAYGPASLNASGGSGVYSWAASGLPSGLSLSSTGVLGGTATSAFSGQVSVVVTDSLSNLQASAVYQLTIMATPLTISGPSSLGSVIAGSSVAVSYTAAGGTPPYTWSVVGVPGISVDSSGTVSGKVNSAGTFSVTLTVTDAKSASLSQTLSVSGFGIVTAGLPPATTTTAYSASISGAGGTTPYSFKFTGLPPGITTAGGSLSGRATAAGSYPVAVQVGDSAGLSVSASYLLQVTGPASLKLFSTSLGDATVGQPYSDSLSASGGSTPYSWSQSGGLLPGGLSLSALGAVTGMPNAPGTYSLGVQVSDALGSTVLGTVTINVNAAPVQITNGAILPSGVTGADYPAQILTASGGVPPYTFGVKGSLPPGLTLSNGQIGGKPTVAGDTSFTLVATDSAAIPTTGLRGVSVRVRPAAPDLVLSSGNISFSLTSGTASLPSPGSTGVASSDVAQSLGFSTSASVPWITASGGPTTPGVVLIGLNSAALALGPAGSPYSGTVTVACTSAECGGKAQSVTVTLSVAAAAPQLTLGTTLLSFASAVATPQASSAGLTLTNSGGGSLKIDSVTSDASWLTVGSTPATVTPGPGTNVNVTADPTGLPAGYYRGTISVASSGGSATAAVTLFISAAPTMTLGPSGTQLSMPEGGVLGNASGSFNVSLSSGVSVAFSASAAPGAPWLRITGGSGTATQANAGTVAFSVDPAIAATLTSGAYYGTIRVTGSGVVNSPQDFQVILHITPASTPVIPDLQPAGLVFISTAGGPASNQAINVYASSKAALPYQASPSADDGGGWLAISTGQGAASANTPGSVTVTANPAGLNAGVYRGIVSFTFGTAVRAVNVTLVVQPNPTTPALVPQARPAAAGPVCGGAQLVPTQTGLVSNFSAPTSWPTPLSIKLVDTCGSSVSNAQIVATFTNGDPPLPLTAINSGNGIYSGTWTPRKATSQISITASVTAPGYPGTSVKIAGQVAPNTAPQLAPNGTGDVFHPQVGAGLGPGNIVQIYGSGLASGTSASSTLPLPTIMNGTSVLIGGVRAPLFYVSPGQVNAQIPFELTAGNQYQVIVSANGALTTPEVIQLNGGTPAILNFSSGAVVAQHLDGSLILDTSPAAPGEYVVIYSSGLGATDIPVASGTASPAEPPARVADPPVLTLNGNPVEVLFSGLTPGLVGLYQVNFQVPPDLRTGNYDLLLTQGGVASNKTVLSVQAPL